MEQASAGDQHGAQSGVRISGLLYAGRCGETGTPEFRDYNGGERVQGCVRWDMSSQVDSRLLAGLSDEQRAAVSAAERYVRAVAAAGGRKTETLTRRILYLLAAGAEPRSIVAFTFTEKAAAEMNERV